MFVSLLDCIGKGFCLRCPFLMLRDLDSDLRGLRSWSFLRTAVFHKFKKLNRQESSGDNLKYPVRGKNFCSYFFICSNPACPLINSELVNNCVCFRAFWRSEGLLFICILLVWGFFAYDISHSIQWSSSSLWTGVICLDFKELLICRKIFLLKMHSHKIM